MGHDAHFLSRLERFEPEHLDVSLSLYRSPQLVKMVAAALGLDTRREQRRARRASAGAPPGPSGAPAGGPSDPSAAPAGGPQEKPGNGTSKVAPADACFAIALEDGGEGPHVVISRAGKFVTCLARGMKPRAEDEIVSRERFDGLSRWHDGIRNARDLMATSTDDRLTGGRLWKYVESRSHRLCREDFELLAAVQPLILVETALHMASAEKEVEDRRARLAPLITAKWKNPDYRLRQQLEAFWRAFVRLQNMAVLSAMDLPRLEAVTPGSAGGFFGVLPVTLTQEKLLGPMLRGFWCVSRAGPYLFESLVPRWEKAETFWRCLAMFGSLAAIGRAQPELRDRIGELFLSEIPAPETDYQKLEPRQVIRAMHAAHGLAALDGSEDLRSATLDMYRTMYDNLRSGRPDPERSPESASLSDPDLIGFVASLPYELDRTDSEEDPYQRSLRVVYTALPLVVDAPAAALYPPRAILPALEGFASDFANALILFRMHAENRPKREPVRAERAPGRNDPCPCGSGRKYKKCCLAAA